MNVANTELTRGILAPFGHVLWTALVGGALFESAQRTGAFRLTTRLVGTFVGVVVLHGAWDASYGAAIVVTRGLVGEGWEFSWPGVADWIGTPTGSDLQVFRIVYDVLLALNALVGSLWIVHAYRSYRDVWHSASTGSSVAPTTSPALRGPPSTRPEPRSRARQRPASAMIDGHGRTPARRPPRARPDRRPGRADLRPPAGRLGGRRRPGRGAAPADRPAATTAAGPSRSAASGTRPTSRTCTATSARLTLDLKSEEGRSVFYRLAAGADVVVENMRPPVKERLGVDYATLARLNPRLSTARSPASARTGPTPTRGGVDQIAQGLGGLMSVTGLPGQGPLRVGVPIADLAAGVYLAVGILAALHERERSGEGRWVQTSLLEAMVAMLDFQAARWTMAGEVPGQEGNHHPTGIPMGCFPHRRRPHEHRGAVAGACGGTSARSSAPRSCSTTPATPAAGCARRTGPS